MQNARLDEAEAGIEIAGRSINNLKYADDRKQRDTKEPLDEGERGEEKAGLKLNIKKNKIMASSPITSRQIGGETMETVKDFMLLGSKITGDSDCSHEIKRRLFLEEKL